MAVKPIEDRRMLGIGMMLGAYLCYTIIDSCAKLMTQSGLPTMEVVFVRYAGQLILVLAFFLPQRGIRTLAATRNLKVEVARGLCLLGSTVTNFLALTFLPLTVTSAISFTMPLILCALSIPMLAALIWLFLNVAPRSGQEHLVLPVFVGIGALFVGIQLLHVWLIDRTLRRAGR